MTPDLVDRLFEVLDMAVFERRLDGAFQPLTTVPDWMATLSRDGTFPFLGNFLSDAQIFWNRNKAGRVGSGLLTVENEAGEEFHVQVWAATARGASLLFVERPPDAGALQQMLQRAREEVLARESAERRAARCTAALERMRADVRTAVESIRALVQAGEQEGAGDATLEAILAAAEALADRIGLER